MLVFQNHETAAILLFQTNRVGIGLFSYAKNFLRSHLVGGYVAWKPKMYDDIMLNGVFMIC